MMVTRRRRGRRGRRGSPMFSGSLGATTTRWSRPRRSPRTSASVRAAERGAAVGAEVIEEQVPAAVGCVLERDADARPVAPIVTLHDAVDSFHVASHCSFPWLELTEPFEIAHDAAIARWPSWHSYLSRRTSRIFRM